MMKKMTFVFLCLFMGIGLATAQTKVTGTVTYAEDEEPIIGASVLVKGTTIGNVTDLDGKFELEAPADSKTLVISYVGMVTREVKVAPHVLVKLESDTQNLEEVVVTGYGVTKKAAFTGAAQVVNSEMLTKKTDANFMKSLEGSVAGLQVSSFSGQPGAFAATTIRGMGSVNSGTEPLYVVDGIAIYTDKMGVSKEEGSGQMSASPMANINPSDIESITVLKDATATAIYGARAANGVIVITTKKGASGKARFNFNAKVGSSLVGKLDNNYRSTNLDRYKGIWAEGLVNAGEATNIEEGYEALYAYAKDPESFGIDLSQDIQSVDWLDAVLRNGFTQDYGLSVQGGNDALRYFISGSYFQNTGIVIGTGMKRYTGRISLDGNSGRVGYGLSVNGAFSDIDNSLTESQYKNPIVAVYDLRPFEQIYNPDGSYNMDAYYNPVALNDKNKGDKNNQGQTTLVANPYFTYKFMDGLTWKTNAGLSLIDLSEFFYSSIYNPQYISSWMQGERNQERATTLSITNTVNFNRSFNEVHNLNVLVGQEAQKITFKNIYTVASNYPSDRVTELGAASVPVAASSMMKASTLSSFFFNGEYNYNNRYYASASFRYDGSSRFGANNKWAPFWSLGAKYRISEEAFMENTKEWLTDLTVRGSYGTVGNQDIGYFAAMGLYEYGHSYDKVPGSIPSQVANPDLKWETVAKADIGVNAVLFNRLTIELDYYNQRTKDMIFEVPLSFTTGYDYKLMNIGEMENQGFEFLINASLINTKEFSWNVNLTGTVNRNKIIRLATDKPIETSMNIRKVGEAYHTFYMPEYAGVDAESGSPLWYKGKEGKETTSNINEAGQRIMGSADPKFYGGLGMNFKYKAFDFSFDMNYSLGNKVYNSGFAFDMQVGHYFLGPVSNYVYENRWQNPGDVTDVPKFVAGDASNANAISSRFLMDGSYLRMKSIVLGYTLPKQILAPATIDNLRVYVSADNLFTIRSKDFIGFDPQARANGVQSWAYPVPMNIMFGLSLGF